MRIPWDETVTFDATKIKRSGLCDDLYELKYLTLITEPLTEVGGFTEVDTGTNINFTASGMTMLGTNAYANGIWRQIARANGLHRFTFSVAGTVTLPLIAGFSNANGMPISTAYGGITLNNLLFRTAPNANSVAGIVTFVAGVEYEATIEVKIGVLNNWSYQKVCISGGVYSNKCITEIDGISGTPLTNPYYFHFQRYTSGIVLTTIKNYTYESGYATDSPTLQFDFDAGTGKKIYGLDFSNLALPTGVDVTNRDYAFCYGDGTPTPSAKYTLTQLKALGAQSGNYQKLTIWEYLNSNGETQVYGAPINADDAIDTVQGAGATAPEAFLSTAVSWGVQSVKLGWGASAGAMTYRVFRDGVDVSGELRNVSTFIDSPVAAGTYEYVVVAENDVDDTSSNTITLTKGAGGLATIYGVLSAIYRAMFNMQKIEKVGSTYYLNTYDDDDTTLVASCALKTFDEADIGDLAGTVTPSIRLKSAISGVGAELTGTIWERVQSVFKKEFNTRKNEEVVVGSGIISETVYDADETGDTVKISQQILKTYDGSNLPSQLNTTEPSQRMRSSI